jgi:metal-dependent hydrolase (beta-lactamase superfamily II)
MASEYRTLKVQDEMWEMWVEQHTHHHLFDTADADVLGENVNMVNKNWRVYQSLVRGLIYK